MAIQKGEMIVREMESVMQIQFVMKGRYAVGFVVDSKERYVIR